MKCFDNAELDQNKNDHIFCSGPDLKDNRLF